MSVNQFTKVCAGCQVELRCKTNGVLLVECATHGFLSIRDADLWHCPVCGHETVVGAAAESLFNHWEGDIVAEVKRREARGQRVVLCWLNGRERDEFLRRGKEAGEKEGATVSKEGLAAGKAVQCPTCGEPMPPMGCKVTGKDLHWCVLCGTIKACEENEAVPPDLIRRLRELEKTINSPGCASTIVGERWMELNFPKITGRRT